MFVIYSYLCLNERGPQILLPWDATDKSQGTGQVILNTNVPYMGRPSQGLRRGHLKEVLNNFMDGCVRITPDVVEQGKYIYM